MCMYTHTNNPCFLLSKVVTCNITVHMCCISTFLARGICYTSSMHGLGPDDQGLLVAEAVQKYRRGT